MCRFAWLLLLSQARQDPRSRFLGCRLTCLLCGCSFLCGVAQLGMSSWLCVFWRTLSPSTTVGWDGGFPVLERGNNKVAQKTSQPRHSLCLSALTYLKFSRCEFAKNSLDLSGQRCFLLEFWRVLKKSVLKDRLLFATVPCEKCELALVVNIRTGSRLVSGSSCACGNLHKPVRSQKK